MYRYITVMHGADKASHDSSIRTMTITNYDDDADEDESEDDDKKR